MDDIIKEYTYIDMNGLERNLKITIKDGINISEHEKEVVQVLSEHAQGLLFRRHLHAYEWVHDELQIPKTWNLCCFVANDYLIERKKTRRGNIIIE
jgi:hypothetical protein